MLSPPVRFLPPGFLPSTLLPCPDPGTPHQFPRNRPRFCYVMTDFTQRTVDFWLRHPPLLPLLEAGVMDVAVYDADPPGAGPNPGPVEPSVWSPRRPPGDGLLRQGT